jgi:hypothetical protein
MPVVQAGLLKDFHNHLEYYITEGGCKEILME